MATDIAQISESLGSDHIPYAPLYISNAPVRTAATFTVTNPLTTSPATLSASASSDDVLAAVESCSAAFPAWAALPTSARRDIFLRAAELCATDHYRDLIVRANVEELGAEEGWGLFNWKVGIESIKFAAGLDVAMKGEWWRSGSTEGGEVTVQVRPLGVIYSISPWNGPFVLSVRAIANPIMCGNTVLLKSSEYSPRSQAIVAQLFAEAGLPPGVLNFISSSREMAPEITNLVIAHPAVKKITFCGSDRVGRLIAAEAARYLKPCVFELGGKSPVIVMEDADLPEAAKAIVFSAMANAGQVCMATERVIAHESICDELLRLVKGFVAKLGESSSKGQQPVPLFTPLAAQNVQCLVQEAVHGGATLETGDLKVNGAIMGPHVLCGVRREMRVWRQETFGPVLIIAPFSTPEEAIELANDTDHSLTAGLWTRSLEYARTLAPQIHSGYVNINGPTIHSELKRGLEGLGGSSGYGSFAVEEFLQRRMMVWHPSSKRSYGMFDE